MGSLAENTHVGGPRPSLSQKPRAPCAEAGLRPPASRHLPRPSAPALGPRGLGRRGPGPSCLPAPAALLVSPVVTFHPLPVQALFLFRSQPRRLLKLHVDAHSVRFLSPLQPVATAEWLRRARCFWDGPAGSVCEELAGHTQCQGHVPSAGPGTV